MKGRVMNRWIVLIVMVLMTGCATAPSKKDIPREEVDKIVVGKTTQKDIYKIFGKPIYNGKRDEQEEWWMYIQTTDTNSRSLSIDFDQKGLVTNFLYTPYRKSLEKELKN